MQIRIATLTVAGMIALAAQGCDGVTPAETGAAVGTASSALNASSTDQNMEAFANPAGTLRTFSSNGALRLDNPFFQDLGTNGRSCVSCHVAGEAWSITPSSLQARFDATDGLDPVFRTVDGANAPNADVSTVEARGAAYSMLLTKGLVRVGIGIPADADFELVDAQDPYGYASANELSLFRRPLPSTNLQFQSAIMWDGRETFAGQSIHYDLSVQANDATRGHAEADADLTDAQREAIVDFETALFTAQAEDAVAGNLHAGGARGGPMPLYQQPFYIGINDVLGADPTGAPFDPNVFTLFGAWIDAPTNGSNAASGEARRAIARGEQIFNNHPIDITGVKGLNDDLGLPVLVGTCSSCHDTPNVGNHSVVGFLDIGLTDASRRTPDFPLYTLRHKVTGQTVQTTDPGRALISGRWADIGKFKGATLRGLAARPPYFHNGAAATLADAVEFYDQRFSIGLTEQQKSDLAAFMAAL